MTGGLSCCLQPGRLAQRIPAANRRPGEFGVAGWHPPVRQHRAGASCSGTAPLLGHRAPAGGTARCQGAPQDGATARHCRRNRRCRNNRQTLPATFPILRRFAAREPNATQRRAPFSCVLDIPPELTRVETGTRFAPSDRCRAPDAWACHAPSLRHAAGGCSIAHCPLGKSPRCLSASRRKRSICPPAHRQKRSPPCLGPVCFAHL